MFGDGKIKTSPGSHNGQNSISGTVNEIGVNGVYLVVLLEQKTQRYVDSVYSNIDGSFAFGSLSKDSEYIVIAFDDNTGTIRNAAIADRQISV